MDCPNCGHKLTFLDTYDEIINDRAFIKSKYFCRKCKTVVKTEQMGEISYFYPEEITAVISKDGERVKV